MGWLISYSNEWEDYSNFQHFGEGVGFPGFGPLCTFWSFVAGLGTVLAPTCTYLAYANVLQ